MKPRSNAPPTGQRMCLAKILVAVDFSDESKKALRYAVAIARQFGAGVTLLHVVEPIVCLADFGYGPVTNQLPNKIQLRRARSRLNLMARRLAGSGSRPATVVRSGVAGVEITQAARDLGTDLLVIGTHDEQDPAPTNGTAQKVVRHAPCPVFVVRKKEHKFLWSEKPGRSA